MALEGLWWTDDMADFSEGDKSAWSWTAMMMQPDHITGAHVETAIGWLRRKKDPPALDRIRFESFREGLSVQVMHIGPYADEAPTIARLHQFAADQGYRLRGDHHEIYLGDPRRTAPERLRTVIRQPVEPVPGSRRADTHVVLERPVETRWLDHAARDFNYTSSRSVPAASMRKAPAITGSMSSGPQADRIPTPLVISWMTSTA